VGINGQPGNPKGVTQNYVGGFTADSGESHQLLKAVRDLTAVVVDKPTGTGSQVFGLGPIQAAGFDQFFNGADGGQSHGSGIWKGLKQGWGDLINPAVSTLGRQNGGHQKLIGILKIQTTPGLRIDSVKIIKHGRHFSGRLGC
jgi:hypothetical protein